MHRVIASRLPGMFAVRVVSRVVVLVVASVSPAPLPAQTRTAPSDIVVVEQVETALQNAISRCEKSVVAIARSRPERDQPMLRGLQEDLFLRQLQAPASPRGIIPRAMATGVIVRATGLILTQYTHVDEADNHIVITTDGHSMPAAIKAADPRSGLAMLQVSIAEVSATDLSAINLGDADRLRKGQFVAAIGNPYAIAADGSPSCSWGIIANLAQRAGAQINLNDAPGRMQDYRSSLHHLGTLIQTDANLTFSVGGGALVNLRGEMIGLTTSAAAIAGHEQPAGYAIPMSQLFRQIIDTLSEGREVEYGLLGIGLGPHVPADDQDGRAGVYVQSVIAGGPAERAGLRDRDLITHVNGQPIGDSNRLQLVVGGMQPARRASIRYLRDHQIGSAEIVLAKYPVQGRVIATNRPPGWRGIHVDYATALNAVQFENAQTVGVEPDPEGCVLVRDVEERSPAWKVGVRKGMFISHVGDQRVSTPEEFRTATAATSGIVGVRLTHSAVGQPDQQQQHQIPPEL